MTYRSDANRRNTEERKQDRRNHIMADRYAIIVGKAKATASNG